VASQSIQAAGHRARQAARNRFSVCVADGVPFNNVSEWEHETAVTCRAEKRKALGEAKRHGCVAPLKDERPTWTHGATCPKWKAPEPKKKPELTAQQIERAALACNVDCQPPDQGTP
jgi:hypothetical protein